MCVCVCVCVCGCGCAWAFLCCFCAWLWHTHTDCVPCVAGAQPHITCQDARRTVQFAVLPPVLHLHLKRFQYTYSGTITKVDDRFEFPESLDMAEFMAPSDAIETALKRQKQSAQQRASNTPPLSSSTDNNASTADAPPSASAVEAAQACAQAAATTGTKYDAACSWWLGMALLLFELPFLTV